MGSFISGPQSQTPHRRWVARAASGLLAALIGLSAMAILLMTPETGVIHGAQPAGDRGVGVAPVTVLEPAGEPCFCAGRGNAAGPTATKETRLDMERLPAVDPDLQQITLADAGAARAGQWVLHNTHMLEQDPRAFLRLMSHLARQNGSALTRLPGEEPGAWHAAQSVSPGVSQTPAPRIDNR